MIDYRLYYNVTFGYIVQLFSWDYVDKLNEANWLLYKQDIVRIRLPMLRTYSLAIN